MSQLPLAKQDTVADPDRMYPLLQLYVTVPPKVVLDGVPEDPSDMEGGEPQSTAAVAILNIVRASYYCSKWSPAYTLI